MGKASWIVFLAVLCGGPSPAQDRPDFTGRWILDSPSQATPDVPTALSVRQPLVDRNVRGVPTRPSFKDITVERQFAGGTRSETHEIGVVGGTVSGFVPDGKALGPDDHHVVRWDANALIFESGSSTGESPAIGAWAECSEVWSLDSDGRLHVVITTRSSLEAPRTVALLYRRR